MNKLYYFTGTGNSLWVAKQVAKSLPGFSLEPIAAVLAGNSKLVNHESALIGLIFPVYLYGPPLIVRRFLEKLEISGNQYVFYIAVHGGYPAQTIRVVRKLIEKKHGHLNCGFCLKMPGNCIIDYDPPPDDLIRERVMSAIDRIGAIVEMVRNRTQGVFERGNPVTNWILTGIFYRLLIRSVPGYSKKYRVEDSCTGCGLCASVCQMNNIKLVDEKPTWSTSCEMCLSCIQNCPVEAIQ